MMTNNHVNRYYGKFQTKTITVMNPPTLLNRDGIKIKLVDLKAAPLCPDVIAAFILDHLTGAPLYLYHGLTFNGRDSAGVLYDFSVRDNALYATFRAEGNHRLNVAELCSEVGIPVVMMGEFDYDNASYRRCTRITGFRINGDVGFKAH